MSLVIHDFLPEKDILESAKNQGRNNNQRWAEELTCLFFLPREIPCLPNEDIVDSIVIGNNDNDKSKH